MAATIALNGTNFSKIFAAPPESTEEKAQEFFFRAELGEALQKIWNSIKRLRLEVVLKLLMAVALIVTFIVLAQQISLGGFLALAGTLAGLLFAAITQPLVWILYILLYFVKRSDFAGCILLAVGLAWLGGFSPFIALIVSPLLVFGYRMLGGSKVAQTSVAEASAFVANTVEKAKLGAAFRQAADAAAGVIGKVRLAVPRWR